MSAFPRPTSPLELRQKTLRNLLDGTEQEIAASALVLAKTNRSFDPISAQIAGLELYLIGDAQAPRQAPYAFHEGRKCGLEL